MSSKCENGCDNKFYNCPPRMSFPIHFTDHRPRCKVNYEVLPKPMTSYDYRLYLTHNAEKLMEDNRQSAWQRNMCAPCTKPSTMLPEIQQQVCDGRTCAFPINDPTGLGTGRLYGGEKESYLPSQERPTGCEMKRTRDLSLYPLDGSVPNSFERMTSPSGGWPLDGQQ